MEETREAQHRLTKARADMPSVFFWGDATPPKTFLRGKGTLFPMYEERGSVEQSYLRESGEQLQVQHSGRSAVQPKSGRLKAHREHQPALAGVAGTTQEHSCCILKQKTGNSDPPVWKLSCRGTDQDRIS